MAGNGRKGEKYQPISNFQRDAEVEIHSSLTGPCLKVTERLMMS